MDDPDPTPRRPDPTPRRPDPILRRRTSPDDVGPALRAAPTACRQEAPPCTGQGRRDEVLMVRHLAGRPRGRPA